MTKADYLIEFEKSSNLPKYFRAVLALFIVIVTDYLLLLYPTFRYRFFSGDRFEIWQLYIYCLLLIYPIVGVFGYNYHKKFGWFILSHYALTNVAIIAIAIMVDGTGFETNVGTIHYLRMVGFLLVLLASIFALIILFRKRYMDVFGLNRTHIFLLVLLCIFFPIVHFMLFSILG